MAKRTKQQNNAIWALRSKRRLSEDGFRALVFEARQGKDDSTRELTFDQANHLIVRLGGTAIGKPKDIVINGRKVSKRTEQHHHQTLGIRRLHTDAHLSRWRAAGEKIGFDEQALQSFTFRTIREHVPTTTKKTNIVIEAMKKMAARGWHASNQMKGAA